MTIVLVETQFLKGELRKEESIFQKITAFWQVMGLVERTLYSLVANCQALCTLFLIKLSSTESVLFAWQYKLHLMFLI